jgi:hypothetical protein
MAVNGTHDTGEEWKQKVLYRQDQIASRDTTLTVGLYNDSTDNLSDSDDIGAISSEPATGNYTRQSLSLDSGDLSLSTNGSGNVQVDGTVTFDVTDTGETIDGFFVLVTYQSDVINSEGSENDHILISGTLGTDDLSQYSSFDVTVQDAMD